MPKIIKDFKLIKKYDKYLIFFLIINFFVFYTIQSDSFVKTQTNELLWEIQIWGSENQLNTTDYIIIAESSLSHDGPPIDYTSDISNPPIPRGLDLFLDDNLPSPYNTLLKDSRSGPDFYKQYNLTLFYIESSLIQCEVNLSWISNEFKQTEYSDISLIDLTENISIDMQSNNYYIVNIEALTPHRFSIICNNGSNVNNPPNPPYIPIGPNVGFHGNSYIYHISTIDPDGDDVQYGWDWDGDNVVDEWSSFYISDMTISSSYIWEIPGLYNLKVKARDIYGQESLWSEELQINMDNRPPVLPNSPNPMNQSININRNSILSWKGGDPDIVDIVSYDVYFGKDDNPPKLITRQTSTSFKPELESNTKYYWRIVGWDPFNVSSNSPLWIFNTDVFGQDGNGGTNTTPGQENHMPIAHISVSDSTALKDERITFYANESYDEDGFITEWLWDLGDETKKSGEIITHSYSNEGVYNVILKVIDNDNSENSETAVVIIGQANKPPLKPVIEGKTTGLIDHKMFFNIKSIDEDSKYVSYEIDWGDGIFSKSGLLKNSTWYNISHIWSNPGVFTIKIIANDNYTVSGTSMLNILINSVFIDKFGYLIDEDNDGIYDLYFNNKTANITNSSFNNGLYFIDTNGDNQWDYTINISSNAIKVYDFSEDNLIFNAFINRLIIFLLASFCIIIILFSRKYLNK